MNHNTNNHHNLVGPDFRRDKIVSYLTQNSGSFYEAKLIREIQSDYQLVSVWHTADLGYCLLIDDQLMCTERDEHYYHEALIYPALVYSWQQSEQLSVLVIGGGDGGSLEEILKYPYLKTLDLVEIDQCVIDVSREYLHSVHKNSFDSANIIIADGFDYIKSCESYDIIYLDLNDPIGDNSVVRLYTSEFFSHLSLKTHRAAVMQIGCYEYNSHFLEVLTIARQHFNHIKIYGQYCPSYHCVNYFLMLSHEPIDLQSSQEFFNLVDFQTKVVDAEYLEKMFVLPKELRKIIME